MSLRTALENTVGPAMVVRLRSGQIAKAFRRQRARSFRQELKGMRALEIGGPSRPFTDMGPVPVYSCLERVDNVNYADSTLWDDTGIPLNNLICEGTALSIESETYDCVLSSHSLEHIANPMKALNEWRRVLKDGGFLLLILPNPANTCDWRRPVTSLEHLRQDFVRDTPEADLFHLGEILAMHDLTRDPAAGSPEQFKARCLRNAELRAMHHHVFDLRLIASLLRESGFAVVRQRQEPFDLITLAQKV